MSAKFKLKNHENWIKFPIDRLSLDSELMQRFLENCPEISQGLITKIVASGMGSNYSFYLDQDHLGLAQNDQKPIYVDIESSMKYHSKVYFKKGHSNEPFYKSIKSESMKVIDITCGMMGDSLLMNFWGFDVLAYEANPIISCLILNALKVHPLKRFKFVTQEFNWNHYIDGVVFYDPFFRKEKEKTSPKKAMQVLRDFDEFDFLSRPELDEKVVVKRPKGSEDIWEKPHHRYQGKSVRYDVY